MALSKQLKIYGLWDRIFSAGGPYIFRILSLIDDYMILRDRIYSALGPYIFSHQDRIVSAWTVYFTVDPILSHK